MTDQFSFRANGESFFSLDDLLSLKAMVEFWSRRSHGRIAEDNASLLAKIDREIEYVSNGEIK